MSAAATGSEAEAESTAVATRLAEFATRFRVGDAPPEVREYAKLCIADAIGIGLASTTFGFAADSAGAICDLAGEGAHPVIGMPNRLPARDAALLNGILVHGLDFDDTHPASIVHCSASAVPLMLAAGMEAGASGDAALAAYVLAVEADARIGRVANGQFQKVGLHPTGAVGIFGCAIAASHLRGQSVRQMATAQGIALSMSAGSLEFLDDGSWTKRLHPGWAASSAMTAVALAGGGFVGPPKAYEGRYGLYNICLRDLAIGDIDESVADFGKTWEVMKVAVKPYPVCHFNHSFIDAALALRDSHGLEPDEIESVTALIHDDQTEVVCEPEVQKRRPGSDYDAKFSLHFAVAAALVRGRFTLDELEDEALGDPAIHALCDRITYASDPNSAFPRYYSGELTITTRDGRVLTHREAVNRGADTRPLSAADVRAKFESNSGRAVSSRHSEAIWDAVMNIEEADGLGNLVEVIGA